MTPDEWLDSVNLVSVRRAILRWYDKHGRDLPWRKTADPYRVWVSEIMLQQTQVATVTAYYARFLERFPTVGHLAAAELADVLTLWQGLGYYRRARDLHAAARRIVAEHAGVVPTDPAVLARLPGLGRYTANAIACFATGNRLPILEANTIRLWTRVTVAVGDPARPPLKERLWRLAERVVPRDRAADFNQALMDLGASVCTSRAPTCALCPLQNVCRARAAGDVERYPRRAARPRAVEVEHVTVIARDGKKVLVVQRPPTGRWAGLWEFPRVEREPDETPLDAAWRALGELTPRDSSALREWKSIRHGIMHYRVLLRCFILDLPGAGGTSGRRARGTLRRSKGAGRRGDPCVQWVNLAELEALPFSSPQRRLARAYRAENPSA